MSINSLKTWDRLKLASASFVVGFLVLVVSEPGRQTPLRSEQIRFVLGAILAALAFLSHGGAAFALLGAAGIVLMRMRAWRAWCLAAAAFVVLAAPWLWYQKLFEPPGNRLLKWHLAGVEAVDDRPLLRTLRESYESLGFSGALEFRKRNLLLQFQGDWAAALDLDSSQFRRYHELTFYLRSAGLYLPLGFLAWTLILFRARLRTSVNLRLPTELLGAMALSWCVWLALMYSPNSALAHQGPYSIPLLLYGLALCGMMLVSTRLCVFAAFAQTVAFSVTWIPAASG